ncbi:MAG TPA: hypothetical protein VGR05_07365, partial [Sphingomicrobium sp.]|nr:hypothetical protein [Sphingomicrobium sp.]
MADPDDLAARWVTLRASYAEERFTDALAQLRAFPNEVRGEFQLVAHEAELLGKLGDHDGEIALLRQLTQQQPAMGSLWV